MKQVISLLLFILVPFVCSAQNERVVKGLVYGENGGPLTGASVYAVGTDISAKTDTAGMFAISVPSSVEELQAECPGYHVLDQRIDGTFMVFKMKLDAEYASRAYKYASVEAKLAQDKEKRMAEAAKAKVLAERNSRRRKLDSLYNDEYKNIGLVHSIEVAYGYQIAQSDVVYKNLGYREYGNLHPLELSYTLAYRFCNWVSLGVGAGLQYQLVNLCLYGDVFDPSYWGQERFTPVNVPLFLNTKVYLSRGKIQPFLSLSGGLYLPNSEVMADFGAGVNLRLNKNTNMYFLLSCRTTPYGNFYDRYDYWYQTDLLWTPSFKLGLTF